MIDYAKILIIKEWIRWYHRHRSEDMGIGKWKRIRSHLATLSDGRRGHWVRINCLKWW